MGLTIHYQGKFKKEASLSEMIEEVKNVAEVNQWKYQVFDDKFPDNTFPIESFNDELYGISFTPPECDTISFTFLSNGKMSNIVNLQIYGNSASKKEQENIIYNFAKTQFAGAETHKKIIHLLRYIGDKYMEFIQVNDEGEYWETRDEELLDATFERYTSLINNFTTAVNNTTRKDGESYEDYFARIMKGFGEKR